MKEPTTYKTRQRDAILAYLQAEAGRHVTAQQIADHFKQCAQSIGLATIYRCLEMLGTAGLVRRYSLEGSTGACFEYVEHEHCDQHFHLKCEKCGRLYHLQCELLAQIKQHVEQDHSFEINSDKTVFYGLCQKCK